MGVAEAVRHNSLLLPFFWSFRLWSALRRAFPRIQRMLELSTPVQYVKGVGPRIAEVLAAKGIHTVGDLLHYLRRAVRQGGGGLPRRGTPAHPASIRDYRGGRQRFRLRGAETGSFARDRPHRSYLRGHRPRYSPVVSQDHPHGARQPDARLPRSYSCGCTLSSRIDLAAGRSVECALA